MCVRVCVRVEVGVGVDVGGIGGVRKGGVFVFVPIVQQIWLQALTLVILLA